MIYSNNLEDLRLVCSEAYEFLKSHDMGALEPGRYELGGENYVNVMEYDTKDRDEGVYEAHRKFADIQVMIDGTEFLEVMPREDLGEPFEVDDEADYVLFDGDVEGDIFILEPGAFSLLAPEDAHMPGIAVIEPDYCKKAVFKIAV